MEINLEHQGKGGVSKQSSLMQNTVDQKQLENVESFNHLGNTITNDTSCTREAKSKIAMAKVTFSIKKTLFTRELDLN
jgi:hypothetical protein